MTKSVKTTPASTQPLTASPTSYHKKNIQPMSILVHYDICQKILAAPHLFNTSQNARVAGQPQPMASEANSSFISAFDYGLGGQLQFHFAIIHYLPRYLVTLVHRCCYVLRLFIPKRCSARPLAAKLPFRCCMPG